MFDAFRWPWSYEPIDLKFYIPDFALRFPKTKLAVEVKPALAFDDLRPHAQRIVNAGWSAGSLVLGAELFQGTDDLAIGALGQPDGLGVFIDRALIFTCLSCGEISLRGDAGSWRCQLCGVDDGNAHVGDYPPRRVIDAWIDAGNRVQWRAA